MEYRPAREADGDFDGVADIQLAYGWGIERIREGQAWIARDDSGAVVGCCRLLDCGAEGVYVADVITREDLRGKGIGAAMMRAAMASRPGPFYLVCHPERLGFYGRLGYADVPRDTWPPEVIACSKAEEDWDSDHDDLHHFMTTMAAG
jgi:GNAT superfamily N-acetyltransferase